MSFRPKFFKSPRAAVVTVLLLLTYISYASGTDSDLSSTNTSSTGAAMFDAVAAGNLEAVQALLKQNPSLLSSKDERGLTPLHVAALLGNKGMTQLLLSNHAGLYVQDNDGKTPAQMANAAGHKEVAEGIDESYNEAVTWDQKAADAGDAQAQNDLGCLYLDAHGVQQDYAEALKWFRKAAEAGNSDGQENLGVMYATGRGVQRDYAEAVKWYRKAAEAGNARGAEYLGGSYRGGLGVEKDFVEALRWFRKAAKEGNSDGQENLGVMYGTGRGVQRDYAEAVKWLRKAADAGNSEGQASLGYMYEKGLGVQRDYAEALKWFRKAADAGNFDGQNNLGVMYRDGLGVEKDYAEALKWLRKAVDAGNSAGQANLGYMYENGLGVQRDYAEAVKWFRKAAAQGNSEAQAAVQRLDSSGSPVSQSNANQLAARADSVDQMAVIKTTEGTMVVEFWPDAAPKTVANFIKLAKSGFYDGTCFHRVIKGFMIQGGDPLTKDPSKEATWGTGGPDYKIAAEFNNHSHVRGVISMARSADPNSAGSQFFICQGNPTALDHQYTAFGKLIKGDDVLDRIANTPTHSTDRPNKRIGIISITIIPAN